MKVGVSHHKILADGSLESTKELVFVMDPLKDAAVKKEEPERKRSKTTLNIKNFGAKLDVSKAKASSKISLAWRTRPATLHSFKISFVQSHHLPPY